MPKSIQSSVGYAGHNVAMSVMTVQYLLNCVPASRGGPVPELVVDGIVGPKTIGAIRRFQTTNLGFADGRVDPGGKTIAALGAYDPYPNQPMSPMSIGKMPMPPAPSSGSGTYKAPTTPGKGLPGGMHGLPGGMPGNSPIFKSPGPAPGPAPGKDPFGKTPGKGFGKSGW